MNTSEKRLMWRRVVFKVAYNYHLTTHKTKSKMKQIKVEITPREWAEKRMQLLIDYDNDAPTEAIDRVIKQCGFVLKEEPEEPRKPITMDDLKEGMRVMLKRDLVDGKRYGGVLWVDIMKKGCEVTIKGKYSNEFCIKECSCNFNYSLEMIEYIIE